MTGKVEIYGSESCRFTVAAIAWCSTRSYPFILIHAPAADNPNKVRGHSLPQIFIGAHRIGGFESLRASDALIQQILGGS